MKKEQNNSKKRRMERVISALKKDKIAIISLIFLAFIIIISLIAPLLPMDPNKTDVMNMLTPPSKEHWFGTDEVGRDYLARVIYGGRVSLLVGVLAMLASVFIGVTVGTISGYCGGIVDMILMRIVDVMSSIPWMILVTVISIFLNPGLKSIIIVIGCFTWMEIARLVRAETLSIKEREYVMYAKFVGTPFWKVILMHIIPSVFPTIIIAATTSIAGAIMTESSLSFLGIGIQQPMSSWGSLLQSAQTNLQNALYMAFIPGLLIVCTIFAFNKLGNLLRIYVEPRVTSGEKE
ncbi:MAG TPA: ABC transporter permease [Candidatus Scybalomonas excrementigallinarum]|nr:ABC transporter permease [Candidatus Scybalomonas excrementigallinarum]